MTKQPKLYRVYIMKTLLKILSKTQFGFITKEDLDDLVKKMPNLKVLIRCGRDRYITTAALAEQKMREVEEQGDYVRDVSLPARVIDELLEDALALTKAIDTMRSW